MIIMISDISPLKKNMFSDLPSIKIGPLGNNKGYF